MDLAPIPNTEPWSSERFRIPESAIGSMTPTVRPLRHRAGEPFLAGPIPFSWIASACRLPGAGLHVATLLRHGFKLRKGPFRCAVETLAEDAFCSPATARRALHATEEARLVEVIREPGCKLLVSILSIASEENLRPPLFGPIPWGWWRQAMRLGGPALPVATACWILAGWKRLNDFEFGPIPPELGISRHRASRGLDLLAQASLVGVISRPGRFPVVCLRDDYRLVPEVRVGYTGPTDCRAPKNDQLARVQGWMRGDGE